jgi:hypothetical protein
MQTIGDVLRRLLPKGSKPGRSRPKWTTCPVWPPDVFAVAAVIVSRSGCYLRRRYSSYTPGSFCSDAYRERVVAVGRAWRDGPGLPAEVQQLWAGLVSRESVELSPPEEQDAGGLSDDLADVAMQLLAISDEAATGMGFWYTDTTLNPFVRLVMKEHKLLLEASLGGMPVTVDRLLPNLPISLCIGVPPTEVCIQPKTRTAQVGCTLRSLSHNLALLPPRGEVKANWMMRGAYEQDDSALNLLLVPFPFDVPQRSFVATGHACPGEAEFFGIDQLWLEKSSGATIDPDELKHFVLALIDQCPARVHGVVFPEIALDGSLAEELALALRAETGIEFLIAGVKTESFGEKRNEVYTRILPEEMAWTQAKHHRWRIDGAQIAMYDLHDLDRRKRWWEDIELGGDEGREVVFWPVRHGAIIGSLICEDLARIEPVHHVFRAVGPNLVIALLMDGPQLERRWPGKCSTALSEDPGSSVLTLTSLGLVRRAERMDPQTRSYKVALWRDSSGGARELELARGAHALFLQCMVGREETWTLDGRSDDRDSISITLNKASDVALQNPPSWANYLRERKGIGRGTQGRAGAKIVK